VTGGAGFIGANLVRRLLTEGHDVYVLVRPASDRWRLAEVSGAVTIVELDVRNRDDVMRTIQDVRPEWLFHLAAYGNSAHEDSMHRIADVVFGGAANLMDACGRFGCAAFVNAGSSSEYGFKAHPPSETERLEPNSYYAVCKAAATLLGQHHATRTAMRVVTLRLYSVYGPWEDPARLIPTLIVRGLAQEWPPLVDPTTAHDFIYVDDVVDAFLTAAASARSGWIYNVGTGIQTSLRQVVEIASRALPVTMMPPWNTMPSRRWDASTWIANPDAIAADLGWTARYDFERGFCLFIDWLTASPAVLEVYRRAQPLRTS
jgi:nucleoside-diphosphate-sugar epimerase